MFGIFFGFMFVTAYAADEIPSFIHPCGRKDPNYSQCFVDNVNSVTKKICTFGLPEFNLPPQEPIIIDKVVIYDTDNLKLSLKDVNVRGFCNLTVTSHYASPDRRHLEFNFTLKNLTTDSVYNFDIRLLVSLANEGLIHVTSDDVDGKVTMDLKEVIKNGKKQIYASKVNTIFKINKFNYEFDISEKNLAQLHEALSKIIKENENEILVNFCRKQKKQSPN
ncbi:uncharacterized protein LOC105839958 isoform X1 [Monomorium pharaonis]|uniref:uncharacterized protein LOC105839958 isoform X1 n=1 Tax=Monomorium pharaonis TaxID=307658 RepID=UPI001746A48A|nr:uncharacterized protein LOC105839958 isoform X1 [Monomorium pharaonis]